MRWLLRVLLAGLLFVWLAEPAVAESRVALVIGNGAYRNTPALTNPVNDATAVAAALRRIGFSVTLATDLDKRGLEAQLRDFTRALRSADVGLFYFAGHGLQAEGHNYLVPIDAQLADETDLEFEVTDLDQVLRLMERSAAVNLLFLDACRDNPLAHTLQAALKTRSIAVGRGLTIADAAAGTLIVYATAPDSVAEDGIGPHSPFTAALLQHMETPGLEIRQILSRVRDTVMKATHDTQIPWDSSSLRGDFFFIPAAIASQPAVAGASAADKEALFWQSIEASTNAKDFEAYLEQFPNGIFAPLARNRIEALATRSAAGEASAGPKPDAASTAQMQTAALPPANAATAEEAERTLDLSRQQRQEIQRALVLLGFDTIGVDGVFGAKTRQVITAWQRSRGFTATGFLTAEDHAALMAQAAPQVAAWQKAEADRQEAAAREAEKQRNEERKRQEEARLAEEQRIRAEQLAAVQAKAKYPSIFEAAQAGDIPALKAFLADGVNVNTQDNTGRTPLDLAALSDNASAVSLLLGAGADGHAFDIAGWSALDFATANRRTNAAQILRANGVPCHVLCP
jgi:uncharacterized caspase-like protein